MNSNPLKISYPLMLMIIALIISLAVIVVGYKNGSSSFESKSLQNITFEGEDEQSQEDLDKYFESGAVSSPVFVDETSGAKNETCVVGGQTVNKGSISGDTACDIN